MPESKSRASREAHIKIQAPRFILARPLPFFVFLLAGLLIGGIGYFITQDIKWWLLVPLVPAVLGYRYVQQAQESARNGDLNPGLVLSLKPYLLAVRVNLSAIGGEIPALKVIKSRSFDKNPKPGDRVPCVCTYIGDSNSSEWEDVRPVPVFDYTGSATVFEEALNRISEEEWQITKASIEKLPANPSHGQLIRL